MTQETKTLNNGLIPSDLVKQSPWIQWAFSRFNKIPPYYIPHLYKNLNLLTSISSYYFSLLPHFLCQKILHMSGLIDIWSVEMPRCRERNRVGFSSKNSGRVGDETRPNKAQGVLDRVLKSTPFDTVALDSEIALSVLVDCFGLWVLIFCEIVVVLLLISPLLCYLFMYFSFFAGWCIKYTCDIYYMSI